MKIKSVLSLSLCMTMMMSVPAHAESRLIGDVDGDGEVGITDATIIQRSFSVILSESKHLSLLHPQLPMLTAIIQLR